MTKKIITLEDLEKNPYLICDTENPTEEMMRVALKERGYLLGKIKNPTDTILLEEFEKANSYLKDVKRPLPYISEELALKAIKNIVNLEWPLAFCFVEGVFLKHVEMTETIAKELVCIEPMYVKYDEVKAIMDEDLERIVVKRFLEKLCKMKADGKEEYTLHTWQFPKEISLTKDDYKYIIDNHLEGYAFHFLNNREDMPLELRKMYLRNERRNLSFIYIDDDLIDYCFDLHSDCSLLPKEFRRRDLSSVIAKHGWIIKLISKPSANERKAAIEFDPMNIMYIKNPSEKDCLAAIKANKHTVDFITKRTKRIREAISCL